MTTIATLDLGDQGLLAAYLSATSPALLNQTYANLLLMQQSLANSEIDSTLAVKIEAYQAQMMNQARYYQQTNLSGLIHLLSNGSNFYALVAAFNRLLGQEDDAAVLAGGARLGQQLTSLVDQAQSYRLNAQALNTRVQVAWGSLRPLMTQFNGVITQLEQDLMADAKRQTELIDALNKAIAANIQAIVDEGGKAGEGVNQLGRAIVTSLTLEQKPADKGAKPATSQEIAKETDQQTQYMISGLEALSSGIAGSSQAARELKTNTDKLAQAYQALAATNTLLSVAKSVQAQNQLFVDTYSRVADTVTQLPAGWQKVADAYQGAVPVVTDLNSPDDVRQLRRTVALNTQSWQLLSSQVDDIKAAYAGNGILPDA
ncbi:HBL/NHE enterotoxin family protein [Aeromonas hydrophila]|uniref:HBL/NHE enterotoxin family protein n=1 Tax=Aeromonas hydrophila TaxID=644 RepID=UPI0015D5A18E|nr:HBL/NHE enterotoxin family protein [Aeromonas hydrophila]